MNRRRKFLFLLWSAPLAAAVAPRAQAQEKISRIGYLLLTPLSEPPSPDRQAFLDGLREFGYVDGKNIQIEYRSAEAEPELLPELAAELVKKNVRVIVTVGTLPTQIAKAASRTVPIVMAVHPDPVGAGAIETLARPGGNVTGLSFMAPELGGKRVELLKETLPAAQRMAVLWNPDVSAVSSEWQAVQKAASRLRVALDSHPVKNANQLSSALASIARKRPDALLIILDARLDSYRNVMVEFAAKHRLPTMMGRSEFAFAGGMMSYAPSIPELFRRAATYVDKILKGARPGDLPIEQPTKFELVINMKTAKALGITIPQSVLARADRVIE